MTIRSRWTRFWFEPAPAMDLAVARILFFAMMFAVYAPRDFAAFGNVSTVFWQPVWLFRALHLPPPAHGVVAVVQVLWKVSLLMSCIGFATRFATATAALLGTYLLGLNGSFGWIDHADPVLVFGMAIFALSRCADACSVDLRVRVARSRGREPGSPSSGEYRWPARMMLLIMACVFFAAGVAKLRHAGVEWVRADALSRYLTRGSDPLGRSVSAPLSGLGLRLARNLPLSRAAAASSLLLELLFPLALFSRRARRLIVPASFALLVAIQVLMGPDFARFLIAYVFFPPWHRVYDAVAARRHRSSGAIPAVSPDPR